MTIKDAFQFGIEPVRITDTDNIQVNEGLPTNASLFRILCKYLFSEVAVQAVTELDNKAAHCHTPVPQWHRPFL